MKKNIFFTKEKIGFLILFTLIILWVTHIILPSGLFWKNNLKPSVTGKSESFTPWVWKSIKVRAVGDFIPHGSVIKSANHHKNYYDSLNFGGFRFLLEPVKHLFKNSKINIVNFETPCAPLKPISGRSYVFNAPQNAINALSYLNFNLFILANNHIYDQGRDGFLQTINEFGKLKINYNGAGKAKQETEKPLILFVDEVKIGIWSFTQFVNDNYNQKDSSWVSIFNKKDAIKKIKKFKDSVDVTIVTFHGGEEYSTTPLKKHIKAFHEMLDAGASVIIGSHPHVAQPIEIYTTKDERETVVFYSLGNFISNQSRKYKHPLSSIKYGDTRDALVANFDLNYIDYGPLGKKWEVSNVGVIPCWVENNFLEAKISKRKIQVVSIYDELNKIDVIVDSLIQKSSKNQLSKSDSVSLKKIIKRKRHFLNRIKRIKKIVGDEFIIKP